MGQGYEYLIKQFADDSGHTGDVFNYVILVPTKALINEVSSKITIDLKELLAEHDYKIVTSAGALALKEKHNFIFVLTPERFLYMMIDHSDINIDYLFVDEAHKISSKDDRSTFYYKVVDISVFIGTLLRLCSQCVYPTIIIM